MILERWEAIDESTLIELCDSNAPETISLEFKQELYSSTVDDKAEFMKDVCALANSEGGDLVIGIAEAKGGAGRVMPIVDPTADRAMRRLGQVLDGSVEPRLSGLQWKCVQVKGGYVLILRVPKSLIGPHRYVVNSLSRFPIRSGTHIADMSYDQLRDAFGRTSTLLDRAQTFCRERRTTIAERLSSSQPYVAIHLIPIESMSGRTNANLPDVSKRYNEFMGYRWTSAGRTFNLDGLLVWEGSELPSQTRYTQVFRNGAVEAVDSNFASSHTGSKLIFSSIFACTVRTCFEKLLAAAKKSGFNGSAVASLSVQSVNDYVLHIGQMFNLHMQCKSDRNNLILPESWIESLETSEVDAVVRPLLDVVWQAFGIDSCSYYDDAGKWCPDRRFQ